MILLVFGVALVALAVVWLSEPPVRDATEKEVRGIAAKCGVVIRYFGPARGKHALPDPPNVSTSIVAHSDEEFDTKANCLNRGLKALGATSFIGDGTGRSLLN